MKDLNKPESYRTWADLRDMFMDLVSYFRLNLYLYISPDNPKLFIEFRENKFGSDLILLNEKLLYWIAIDCSLIIPTSLGCTRFKQFDWLKEKFDQ